MRFNIERAQRRQLGLGARRLVLDIENEKSTYERYGPGEQRITGADLVEPGHITAVSWGWWGSDDIHVLSVYNTSRDEMIAAAHRLLSEAEYVIGHNFKRHDRGKLNAEFGQLGLNFPEYAIVDTLQLTRKVFAQTLPSGNALKDVAPFLGLGEPVDRFHLLLPDLKAGKPSAIQRFHEYSKHDIVLTKALYGFLVERLTGQKP